MNKPLVTTIAVVLLLVAAIFGYRSYKAGSERAIAAQRATDERMAADFKKIEEAKRVAAETEARRLLSLKSQQEAIESEKRLTQLRAEQAVAEAARKAAEQESARLAAQTERLRREKEISTGEARRLAEAREREALAADQARRDALDKLDQIARQKQEVVDREAARLAALRRQQELELSPARAMVDRAIYSSDYKRREHYYMQVDIYNSGGNVPPPGVPSTSPAKSADAPLVK